MLQEETIKKITEVMQPLVKLNIFTQEEIDALQRVNEPAITMQKKKDETPEKIGMRLSPRLDNILLKDWCKSL